MVSALFIIAKFKYERGGMRVPVQVALLVAREANTGEGASAMIVHANRTASLVRSEVDH